MTEHVNRKEIALALGVDATTIDRWRLMGLPVEGEKNKQTYPLDRCIQWLVNFRVAEARKEFDKQHPDRLPPADEAKLRSLVADAVLKEIDVNERLGELVSIEDFENELTHYATVVRNALLSAPARWAPFYVQLQDEPASLERLQKDFYNLMTDIAAQANAEPLTNDDTETTDDDSDVND